MIRAYRFAVTVYVDGDKSTVPDIHEIAEHVATQVQDADDHDLACHVRPIETEDYDQDNPGRDTYPKTKGLEVNPRGRRGSVKVCCDSHPGPDRDDPWYVCSQPKGHEGKHCDTRHPLHPEWD